MKKRFRIPSPELLRANVVGWFRERIDIGPVVSLAAKKTVPVHRHGWIYLLGGTAMFLFGLQVASGALLMLYYQPTEDGAHRSVQRIMTEVPLGSVVRSVHAWGANLLIAAVGLHFLVKLFSRAYRRPREMTWLSGMLLLFLTLGFGFSGYLLPWNELSFYATRAGTEIPATLPVVGDLIRNFLRGGEFVTGHTLTRFYAAHVMFLPLLSGALLAVHLVLTQVQGMSLPLGTGKETVRDSRPFFSEFVLIELCIWLLLFGAIVTLATLLPAEVGVEADRLEDPAEEIRPEWYFLFMFQTLKFVPEAVGVPLFGLAALFLLLVPFVDRRAMRQQKSPRLTVVFLLLVAYAVGFEIWAMATGGGEASGSAAAEEVGVAGDLVSLALFWAVIGFLVFFLRQLLKENARIRRLYD